jgi:subtilisin family serine protease
MGRLFFAGIFGLTATLLPLTGMAQQSAARFPVIVVFHEYVPFQSFRDSYRADDRERTNPELWHYLDRGVMGTVQTLERTHGFRAEQVYDRVLQGFAARLTGRQVDELEHDPRVAYVEPDSIMTIVAQTLPWGINRIDADISSTKAGNGSGAVSTVNAYVIDTGIATHADLNRVAHVNFAGDGQNTDCNGHGTHVAGTIAARDNTRDVVGVAPGARLTGVKVLGCNGSGWTSNVIKGVDWVTANAVKPAVANMSLGGSASQALDDAVKRSVDSGVFYAIAAGNSGVDACSQSPARIGTYNGVMTTAAIDSNDNEPSWSNFGPCVDIWAPGVSIQSTRRGGGTTILSGTSMASPHVAGTGTLYLSSHAAASPAAVESQLKADAVSTGKKSKDGWTITRVNAALY